MRNNLYRAKTLQIFSFESPLSDHCSAESTDEAAAVGDAWSGNGGGQSVTNVVPKGETELPLRLPLALTEPASVLIPTKLGLGGSSLNLLAGLWPWTAAPITPVDPCRCGIAPASGDPPDEELLRG